MLLSSAFAQDAAPAAAAGPDAMLQFLPIILIFVVFYFLLIRPQQKKLKVHKEMLGALRRGDRVVTGGGIIGTITKVVDDNEVLLEIAEGVRVRVQRPMISGVLAKTEPAPEAKGPPRNDNGPAGGPPPAEGEGKLSGGVSKLTKIFGGKRD
ncbi:MAG: preprotein translocase subunit YajC [Rhodospirillales bacterium]|nr:preprotein translocase subunit YajC [Rhodospirillales bacterium]